MNNILVNIIDANSITNLKNRIDIQRFSTSQELSPISKSHHGQFLTPISVASFMASLFTDRINNNINLLDAGAGIGSLSSAFIFEICKRKIKPKKIHITAFEIDPLLFDYLDSTIEDCRRLCNKCGIILSSDIIKQDFIEYSVNRIGNRLYDQTNELTFSHAILNPPYKKINSNSHQRTILNSIGIEANNMYSAFISLAIKLLQKNGELSAITPRSFCNGPYFKQFRKILLNNMSIKHIHLFDSRTEAFIDESVLQENIIFHCVKNDLKGPVNITSSYGLDFDICTQRKANYCEIVKPNDQNSFIHIATNRVDQYVIDRLECFDSKLEDLGINVSTGGLVDFRVNEFLLPTPNENSIPLIYPSNFREGLVKWPGNNSKKANAVFNNKLIQKYIMPSGYYVLTKRFSPKEEVHRISAAIFTPDSTKHQEIAFENHLNVFHANNHGLSIDLAKGLYVYLSSTLLDIYFRQFSGHTQINATDLRSLTYPSRELLIKIGKRIKDELPTQEEIDKIIENEVNKMAKYKSPNPVFTKKKIEEGLMILKSLGFPKAQQNDRSSLALLALLGIEPNGKWTDARAIMIGITPIMEFCKKYYGREYAPNTRETFRRQTMHQFISGGLVVENPDCPDRSINSPKWCYVINSDALRLIQKFNTSEWGEELRKYLSKVQTLTQIYEKNRNMLKVPVKLNNGNNIELSSGSHNELIKSIIEEFASRFTPGANVLYIGDTANKWCYSDDKELERIGVTVDSRGKMPDVIIYYPKHDWLLLIEAVTSHGPVDSKRREELCKLFDTVKEKLVFVTAFPSRSIMTSYLNEISWETEVWIAENPTHLIHFNGKRFLGPYDI